MHWGSERVTREALFVFTPMGARTFQLESVDAGDAFFFFHLLLFFLIHLLFPYRVKKKRINKKKQPRGEREVQESERRTLRTRRRETTNQLTAVYIQVQRPREIHLQHKSQPSALCVTTRKREWDAFLADFCSIQMTFSGCHEKENKKGNSCSIRPSASVLPRLRCPLMRNVPHL